MKPNIVIIVWDAVRAQNLPFYGYSRNTTPFLRSIEKNLTIYKNAISSSYWTLPSITSLFTGMYSSGHGLLVDGDKLNPSLQTLTEILSAEGYHCGAFNRNPYVSDFTGLDRGFHDYVSDSKCLWDHLKRIEKKFKTRFSTDPSFNPDNNTCQRNKQPRKHLIDALKHLPDGVVDSGSNGLVRMFSDWIEQRREKPFFAFFQSLETHSPYRAPLRFGLSFLSLYDLIRKLFINQDHMSFLLGNTEMTSEHFRILRGAYDNSIRYSDFITHKICQILKTNKLFDNTLLIIMSDHGESIGEHGLMFHIWSLYDNLIKVPLLIKFPKEFTMSGSVEKIVQNVDVLPTILSILGIKNQEIMNRIQGNSLFANRFPKREENLAISELIKPFGPDKIAYRTYLSKYDRRLLSIRTRAKKYIFSSRGDHEFYDLQEDPDELNNLYGKVKDFDGLEKKALVYQERMEACYQANRARIEGEIASEIENDDIKEQLKQLGYL